MTIKAKRRLSDISFTHEGAHVALVSKGQGGAANGYTTLVTKATDKIEKEFIDKATKVTVELQFPEFLRKFFGMYWDDAEVLSVAMGYGRTEYEDADVKDWIDQKVESISILKSVYRAPDLEKALADLTPEQSVAILKDQEMLEKALENLPEQTKIKHEDTPLETILKSAHIEALADAVAVEKAASSKAVVEIQKALDAQAVVLKAAQDQLAVYEAVAATAKVEARKAAVVDAKVPADKVESVLKSLESLSDEAFTSTVETMKSLASVVDNSDMMQEAGVAGSGAESQKEIDRTTEILKARYGSK
ncbi:hypothetical protein vB_PsyM_KIL3b_0053 [Pseudomonas phage vB_PsyM_KIL3b]|uniref:Uncharacterized protein n=3 Tax=Pseudomonas phage vB_PsyM_KIL1 TaxID=1777065 RepID=A0A142IFW3_9CAUD|nr:hypothetical protein BH774_gp149 [Pseudomonas phage vB_PsyM_KIL1]AMR57300.1 hypothetical protein vB_PsyM_KIL1_0053 [Pseudomonas phage vB_PsyM_KIL1]AMR57620.1 hypothetical protein vB_PsyM_KIL3_0053 [Pseudomonas phage vB_PsyM_KIL3]AMR58118.1 hypothetical protein vB_PsyM_KIL3b_0053 [Pseudomonas phage vB_PsyM_KIL3b]